MAVIVVFPFFFSSRRRHTRFSRDWSSDVCSSDLSFIVTKKENLVLDDGAAAGESELVLSKLAFIDVIKIFKIVRSIKLVVAKELPYRSEERRVGKECRSSRNQKNSNKRTKQF